MFRDIIKQTRNHILEKVKEKSVQGFESLSFCATTQLSHNSKAVLDNR